MTAQNSKKSRHFVFQGATINVKETLINESINVGQVHLNGPILGKVTCWSQRKWSLKTKPTRCHTGIQNTKTPTGQTSPLASLLAASLTCSKCVHWRVRFYSPPHTNDSLMLTFFLSLPLLTSFRLKAKILPTREVIPLPCVWFRGALIAIKARRRLTWWRARRAEFKPEKGNYHSTGLVFSQEAPLDQLVVCFTPAVHESSPPPAQHVLSVATKRKLLPGYTLSCQ